MTEKFVISSSSILQNVVEDSQESVANIKSDSYLDAEHRKVELNGRKRFFTLRDQWSKWVICWVCMLITFNIVVTICVGLKWLDYSNYEWFITIVVVETFLQVVGLGYVAVKYLFSDTN